MDGVQLPQGWSHFEEAVYFLPLSSQKFLVLVLATSEGWKAESTLKPPSGFKYGTLDWKSSPLTTRHITFQISLVWLQSFWIEYGNNYQLLFFPEFKFSAYLCNLRWRQNRFQNLKKCYGGIFSFPILIIWGIDLLNTCYIYADFQT